ncbi:MAG: hypothetical protein J6N54_06995 [Bacteroidales bacterium]|nr:hypothetical protein [Bacteroidales bacterium]
MKGNISNHFTEELALRLCAFVGVTLDTIYFNAVSFCVLTTRLFLRFKA